MPSDQQPIAARQSQHPLLQYCLSLVRLFLSPDFDKQLHLPLIDQDPATAERKIDAPLGVGKGDWHLVRKMHTQLPQVSLSMGCID